MWKDAHKMTRGEIEEELVALKKVRDLSNKVNVDKIINQELDLERFLSKKKICKEIYIQLSIFFFCEQNKEW